ncbi:MAG: zinc-binding dehydrogenase [Nitrospirota bacterium]|nr:zinc-binding dehydrogenase [Nitrospirota bacterium]
MKALYYDEFKGHRGIKMGEFPVPEIAENEVLVQVKAFSLNHLDVWVMEGKYPVPVTLPHTFGSDSAGIVVKAGKLVTHVAPGDEVIIYPGLSCGKCIRCCSGRDNECKDFSLLGVLSNGVSAEYVKASGHNIFKKPQGLSFAEAAGIGITYTTSWNSLILRAGIQYGDTVLVHAAGSGVGTALIQTARLFGATVIATVGDDWKIERARELGADHVINHTREDFVEAVRNYTSGELADIVIDHVGAATFSKSLAATKRGGRVVTFGATTGDEASVSLRHIFGKNMTIHGVYVGPRSSVCQYLRLFPRKLKTVVDSVFDFENAAGAYEKLLSRRFFGKIVVQV